MTVPTAFLRNSDAHKAGPCAGVYLLPRGLAQTKVCKSWPCPFSSSVLCRKDATCLSVRMGAPPCTVAGTCFLIVKKVGRDLGEAGNSQGVRHTAEVTSLGQLTCDIGGSRSGISHCVHSKFNSSLSRGSDWQNKECVSAEAGGRWVPITITKGANTSEQDVRMV